MIFTVDKVVEQNLPSLHAKPWLAKPTKAMLRFMLNEQECNEIASEFSHLQGRDFVEQVLRRFNISYTVPDTDIENLPPSGRVVIFANHPIGSLDALVLIKLISEVRSDLKVVANELLMHLTPLHNILLPVRNMTGGTPKQQLENIHQHLNQDGAVLIFPAGEVSRLRPNGVRDTHWHSGFVRLAQSCQAPLLPIFVNAKNSAAFYGASMLYKPLATLLLVKEMFKQHDRTFPVRIGGLIAADTISGNDFNIKTKVNLLKNHLYRIGKNRSGIFNTQSAIAHPEDRQALQRALSECELLGETQDAKQIYLYRHQSSSPIMREIGRLREVAFRAVGEGTGKQRDTDQYDPHYWHLVLWDRDELEIVGAYRFADAQQLHQQQQSLYSESLFTYQDTFTPYFAEGLELGRSFVQPKYWGKRSLDYLWFGIGAFLAKNPQYRYLFGPVTISNQLPPAAKEMLVHFYQRQFPAPIDACTSHQPFKIADERRQQLDASYQGFIA